jgi:hypothetical protein
MTPGVQAPAPMTALQMHILLWQRELVRRQRSSG